MPSSSPTTLAFLFATTLMSLMLITIANAQNADLTVINNCPYVLWLEARATVRYNNQWVVGAPLPNYGTTTYMPIGGTLNFTVPSAGLAATRFWAKYGCNAVGRNCLIGDQMQYWGGFNNPNGGCPQRGCSPPVDSLFEATWGCTLANPSQCALNPSTGGPLDGTTWFDTSHADGYTLPYLVEVLGSGSSQCDVQKIDGSKLDLKRCPTSEDLSMGGQYPWATDAATGRRYSLTNATLQVRGGGSASIVAVACVAPCKLMNAGFPFGYNQAIGSSPTMWMCCPTPVQSGQPVNPQTCQPANGCITSEACIAGPVATTKYVQAIHEMIPNTYAYAYDDVLGLHTCPAGRASFRLTFCPSGSPQYPIVP